MNPSKLSTTFDIGLSSMNFINPEATLSIRLQNAMPYSRNIKNIYLNSSNYHTYLKNSKNELRTLKLNASVASVYY